jgi:hypothetical protein
MLKLKFFPLGCNRENYPPRDGGPQARLLGIHLKAWVLLERYRKDDSIVRKMKPLALKATKRPLFKQRAFFPLGRNREIYLLRDGGPHRHVS